MVCLNYSDHKASNELTTSKSVVPEGQRNGLAPDIAKATGMNPWAKWWQV
jgi:hypothetical protein